MARLLYYLCIFLPAGLFAQGTISGRVINQADNKPIPDASVFLSNATIGSKTGADGVFMLNNVKSGKYDLIVSVIGFQIYTQSISVENGKLALPAILLTPETIALGEVTVKSEPDPRRNKYIKWFTDEFLGTSWRADECKLTNPGLLKLHYNDSTKILTASSTDLLQVQNNALGYQIKYLLSSFSKNSFAAESQKVQFKGWVYFEDMNGTAAQERRWQKRRLEVYQGSLMHFLRCALNNTFEDAGFRVYRLLNSPDPQRPPDSIISAKIKLFRQLAVSGGEYKDSLDYWQAKALAPAFTQLLDPHPLKQGDFIKLTDEKGLYALDGKNGSLLVVYYKDHLIDGSEQLGDRYDPLRKIKTVINFNNNNVLFDKNGNITDPASLSLDGDWAAYRLAELLPVDYSPAESSSKQADQLTGNFAGNQVSSDPGNLKTSLLAIKAKSDSVGIKLTPEKIYLQFDKPYYALGDTIWFKAWLLNNFLAASDKSGILNIDIANDSNKVIRRYRLPVQSGLTWGNIVLDDKYFAAGTYTLRAYTNWMRNFGDEGFFYKTIPVSSAGAGQPLVNAGFGNSTLNGVPSVEAKLRFTSMTGLPIAAQPLTLQLINDNKHLGTQKYITGVDGAVDVKFTMPQKALNLNLVALNDKKERLAIIPVPITRPQDADIQFLPEGGNLVAGLPAHIGFKAVGEDGKGLDVSGVVIDHSLNQVASFKSLHNGMGSFNLDIEGGETYSAQVKLADGSVKQYPLPAVKSTGTLLSVKNDFESDSLHLTVAASKDIAASGQSFFLIGRARGIVCYAAIVNFHEGNSISKKIAKALFPSGIAHFTLMTTVNQPVNERLVFIGHSDNLRIKLSADKPFYGKRDSVGLRLKVTDQDGDAVSGNFSIAVTDDSQVRLDSLNGENIATRLLLTADLKGYVEQPGYYLSNKSPEAWQALDNLLLTQGWIGYDWSRVIEPQPIAYQPERGFAVRGHVFNVFNKPVKGTHVLLFSKKPAILMDTLTNQNGQFVFDRLPWVDTPLFVLKAVNKNGKSFNINLNIDEIPAPDFKTPVDQQLKPWYVNIDSALITYTKNADAARLQQDNLIRGHLLNEVKVTAKKIIKGSENLNGSGNADVVLDEKDLENSGKKTFKQLFEQNIKGFREVYHGANAAYMIYDKSVVLIVDGVLIDSLYNQFDIKQYIEFHDAEDIKGMEVIYSPRYALNYISRFYPFTPIDKLAFIEITTRSGNPIITNTPGMYLYKPLPLSWPAAFYKPKYTVKDTSQSRVDLRSTIDWEPNIVTDANGEATIWFYTADKPSTYTITIEGTDLNGHFGYKSDKINIGTTKEKSR